ncbi:NUDIX hydrolase [Thermogemmatispora carboxidivorans]|uniref:NUDIX hydrolase n=1 Tax=Thermogemmatispora carboxidivorans TaxID=1382306 RepID=UPI00069B2275|nr:NUDIX hydrolase [Thermogemmatispora carboxidivorans]
MREFEILVRGCFDAGRLVVSFDERLRMPRTQHDDEDCIEACWRQKMQEMQQRGAALYNGTLYRLANWEVRLDGCLWLELGVTSYKEYVASRDARFAQGRGRRELSNPLAVCSVIETADGQLLIERRRGVDVYEGRYHVIGGFSESERDRDNVGQPDLFGAIQREIREETGLRSEDIVRQLCLGLVYDLMMPHPELCFLTCLRLPLEEVRQRQPEDREIERLLSLPARAESLRSFLFTHHGQISATGEPALLFYGGWRFGEAWYAETLWRLT